MPVYATLPMAVYAYQVGTPAPDWIKEAIAAKDILQNYKSTGRDGMISGGLSINTPLGIADAHAGDYIIQTDTGYRIEGAETFEENNELETATLDSVFEIQPTTITGGDGSTMEKAVTWNFDMLPGWEHPTLGLADLATVEGGDALMYATSYTTAEGVLMPFNEISGAETITIADNVVAWVQVWSVYEMVYTFYKLVFNTIVG